MRGGYVGTSYGLCTQAMISHTLRQFEQGEEPTPSADELILEFILQGRHPMHDPTPHTPAHFAPDGLRDRSGNIFRIDAASWASHDKTILMGLDVALISAATPEDPKSSRLNNEKVENATNQRSVQRARCTVRYNPMRMKDAVEAAVALVAALVSSTEERPVVYELRGRHVVAAAIDDGVTVGRRVTIYVSWLPTYLAAAAAESVTSSRTVRSVFCVWATVHGALVMSNVVRCCSCDGLVETLEVGESSQCEHTTAVPAALSHDQNTFSLLGVFGRRSLMREMRANGTLFLPLVTTAYASLVYRTTCRSSRAW
jgi:hypothetical protein